MCKNVYYIPPTEVNFMSFFIDHPVGYANVFAERTNFDIPLMQQTR